MCCASAVDTTETTMSTFKCKHKEFSVNLSNQLEEKGINDDIIQTRRKTFTRIENMLDLHFKDEVTRFLGSQSEGTATADSDLDKLWYFKKFNVVQSDVEKVPGKCNFTVVEDDTTAPGYCRVHLLLSDWTKFIQHLLSLECSHDSLSPEVIQSILSRDSSQNSLSLEDIQRAISFAISQNLFSPGDISNLLLDGYYQHLHLHLLSFEVYRLGFVLIHNPVYDNKNICVQNEAMLQTRNFKRLTKRPLFTKRRGPTTVDESKIDNVGALPLASWPIESEDWICNKRMANWPSHEMMDQIKNHTCLLVPVGHRKSDRKFVEWRISYSITERYLIFNMNTVQLQCFVLLKLIKKRFLNKKVSSYHLKTILFFTVAASNEKDWTKDKLYYFVLQCLKTLALWLQSGYCPHFINSKINLFQGKFSLDGRKRLRERVNLLIENETTYLHKIENQIMSKMPSSVHITQYLRYNEIKYRSLLTNDVIGLVNSERTLPRMMLKKVYLDEELKMRSVLKNGSFEEREAAQALLPGIVGNQAAIEASECVLNGQPVCDNILEKLKSFQTHDNLSSILKLATLHHILRENDRVFSYLEYFIKEGSHENLFTVCPQQTFVKGTFNENWKFACCVRFLRQEIPICPRGLVYEMYRSTKHDRKTRHAGLESWMDAAEIDPLPYFYYLKALLLYKEVGQNKLGDDVMMEMERYVNTRIFSSPIAHPETIYNLLGQWYANQGQITLAFKYYTLSLKRRPNNNAANWLLCLLLYKENSKSI